MMFSWEAKTWPLLSLSPHKRTFHFQTFTTMFWLHPQALCSCLYFPYVRSTSSIKKLQLNVWKRIWFSTAKPHVLHTSLWWSKMVLTLVQRFMRCVAWRKCARWPSQPSCGLNVSADSEESRGPKFGVPIPAALVQLNLSAQLAFNSILHWSQSAQCKLHGQFGQYFLNNMYRCTPDCMIILQIISVWLCRNAEGITIPNWQLLLVEMKWNKSCKRGFKHFVGWPQQTHMSKGTYLELYIMIRA